MGMLTQNPSSHAWAAVAELSTFYLLVRPREIFSAKGSDVLEARAQRHQYRPDDDQHGPGEEIPGRRFLPTQIAPNPSQTAPAFISSPGLCPEDVPITPT